MKPMKTNKANKANKAKRVSKIAKGKFAKSLVLKGRFEKTQSGVKMDGLMKNKRGKVVSKRQSAAGKRRFKNIEQWVKCVMEARRSLQISGFCAVNGKTLQGKALYLKCKAMRSSCP